MLYISISLYQRIATKIIKLQDTTVLCSCRKRDKEQMSKIAVIYFPLLRIDWNIPGPAITKIFIMLNSVLEWKVHKFEVKSKTWGWELTWGKVVTKGPVYAYGKMCVCKSDTDVTKHLYWEKNMTHQIQSSETNNNLASFSSHHITWFV